MRALPRMQQTPISNEFAKQKQWRPMTPPCQATTAIRDGPNGDTDQLTRLRWQISRRTSTGLRFPEGFFVRRRREPRMNCLTQNARTQCALGRFCPCWLILCIRTKGVHAWSALPECACGPDDTCPEFSYNGINCSTGWDPLFLDVLDRINPIVE